MKVSLQAVLSDSHLDSTQNSNQRQLAISMSAVSDATDGKLPLNLCLILDRSGSMKGRPINKVKQAAVSLVQKLKPSDRLSIISFNHKAKVLIANQMVGEIDNLKKKILNLEADGGTAIDEGMKLGLKEAIKGKEDGVSQIFLLTDGENEHGDNQRCLELASLACFDNITINTLGFGSHWNQDVLEQIADSAIGTLCYIEKPEQAMEKFSELFTRIKSVSLTNAYILIELMPQVRLAELKPVAQVAPDIVELPIQREQERYIFRLGDLMCDDSRVVLANLYLANLPLGSNTIAKVQVRYDDPGRSQEKLLSENIPVEAEVQQAYQPKLDSMVQKYILALAKYRQTKIAETKLQLGDRSGAATMLQTAAKTALQLGDKGAATVLQTSATQLQSGAELSEAERKKTRIVSKTILQK